MAIVKDTTGLHSSQYSEQKSVTLKLADTGSPPGSLWLRGEGDSAIIYGAIPTGNNRFPRSPPVAVHPGGAQFILLTVMETAVATTTPDKRFQGYNDEKPSYRGCRAGQRFSGMPQVCTGRLF